MSTTETENGTSVLEAYVPFTPFEESYAFEAQPSMRRLVSTVTPARNAIMIPAIAPPAI